MTDINILKLKDSFFDLLRSVNRHHTENILNDLDSIGFFESPASRKDHLSYPGGLLKHSLNVYRVSTLLANDMRLIRPDLHISKKSIIVSSLLHDVCKAGRYLLNSEGEYVKDYTLFPAGHGEASVIFLLERGFPLTEDEILAIRYHMGPWMLPSNEEVQNVYRQACLLHALVPILYAADSLAAQVLEVE